MYSPKISPELIPELYKLARARKIPMTKLVDRIIKEYLKNQGKIGEKSNVQEGL